MPESFYGCCRLLSICSLPRLLYYKATHTDSGCLVFVFYFKQTKGEGKGKRKQNATWWGGA